MPHSFSTGEVLARLEILHKKLEDEGSYVSSNTAWLAIEEIKRLVGEKSKWNEHPDQTSPMTVGPEQFFEEKSK